MCSRCAILLAVATVLAVGCSRGSKEVAPREPPHFARQFELGPLLKGSVHIHTSLSDGDSSPAEVARWYREHGYAFIALTDHNRVTDEATAKELSSPDFTVLRGEEVSMWHAGRQVHVNALCTRKTIGGGDFASAAEAIRRAVRLTSQQGGVALINHPNFDWAVSIDDVGAFAGAALIEVASGHPYVRSKGDAAHPSHEAMWDAALSRGIDLMGVAVDDMHHVDQCGEPSAYPGKGWVFVSTSSSDPDMICDALRDGLLVASTGPSLERVEVRGARYVVVPAEPDAKVTFIGASGVLATGVTSYELRGNEGWVRARVDATGDTQAWTPAVRVAP